MKYFLNKYIKSKYINKQRQKEQSFNFPNNKPKEAQLLTSGK